MPKEQQQPWTLAAEAELVDLIRSSMPIAEVAKRLGRTQGATRARLSRLSSDAAWTGMLAEVPYSGQTAAVGDERKDSAGGGVRIEWASVSWQGADLVFSIESAGETKRVRIVASRLRPRHRSAQATLRLNLVALAEAIRIAANAAGPSERLIS